MSPVHFHEGRRTTPTGARWPDDPLQAITMFHRGKDPAHAAMRRFVKRLHQAGIAHAVMGGMAVYVHGYRRMTDDVDVLLTRTGLDAFRRRFVPKHYDPVPKRPRRFVERASKVILDILVTGLYPGRGEPGPIAFPNPVQVRRLIRNTYYIDFVTLIELKLAARRYQDFADVVNLIRARGLDESFLAKLHKSVRQDFIECLEEKRREEEYEAREEG
jgi:hypothetical protein